INMSDLPKAATNGIDYLRSTGLVPDATLEKAESLFRFLFAPSSDPNGLGATVKKLAESVADVMNCILIDRIVPVANETAMEEVAMCLQKQQQYFSGVVLSGLDGDETSLPSVVTYKIRHPAD
ncbi:hypothetical protein PFISCL1PPCAC_28490, partial [Pristionchus fissidentatus]